MPDLALCEVPATATQARTGLHAVALFEFFKGVLALLAAGGLEMIGPLVLRGWVHTAAAALGLDARDEAIATLSQALNPDSIHLAAGIAVLYAAMRLVEALGLWRGRAWASWLGCIGAAVYLPFDLYALVVHPGALLVGVLVVNVWVVWVLARDLMTRRRASRASSPPATMHGYDLQSSRHA
ncbi:DUF2127 domain-containing protein [Agrilutibacter solisilvae]|uniref:DUF2127 domain-containing protein n=1 Tax=Agrilutibacter solisilvae TaxID=2763317 RepID=UPI001FD64CEC|nr:DUF2127 domain-containing protein [Lysobacter solisilvae]